MSRRRYPPNGDHTAEGATLFRPTGFEHVPLFLVRDTSSGYCLDVMRRAACTSCVILRAAKA